MTRTELWLCAGFAAMVIGEARAEPADYIFSPEVEQGEREIDSKAGVAWDRDGQSTWGGKLGVEYGFTSWWSSEATVNFGRERGESTSMQSLEWENRFQLYKPDDLPWVIGALLEVEREHDRDEGYELRFGPLLQTRWGALQANLNLLFERQLSARDGQEPTEFGYQWQLRWRRDAAFDWGAQGFGGLGRWDRWAPKSEQSHILGPAVFARLGEPDDEGDESPEFEAGLLFGTGGAAPRVTLRLQGMIPF